MKDIKEIIRALKVFGNDMILYNSESGETISFQDIVDFVEAQNTTISKCNELLGLQKENIAVTHNNNNTLRSQIECLKNIELRKQVEELKVYLASEKVCSKQSVKDKAREILKRLKSEVIIMEIPHGSEPCEEDVEAVMWWQIKEYFKEECGVEVE